MPKPSHPDSTPRPTPLAVATPPPVAPMASEAPTLDGLPQRIGRYEIRSLLGEGGMGRVYLAFDTELERPIALKVIHRHLVGNERILARFRQEARAVARLNHPGIVHIYEFGQDQGAPGGFDARGEGAPGASRHFAGEGGLGQTKWHNPPDCVDAQSGGLRHSRLHPQNGETPSSAPLPDWGDSQPAAAVPQWGEKATAGGLCRVMPVPGRASSWNWGKQSEREVQIAPPHHCPKPKGVRHETQDSDHLSGAVRAGLYVGRLRHAEECNDPDAR